MKRTTMDPGLARALDALVGGLWRCQQCGECSAVCPSDRHGGLRCGELMARASLGAIDLRTEGSIWSCAACQSCAERCPSGVSPSEVVAALRELAAEQGNVPAYLKEEARRFLQTGLCFPRTGLTRKLRKELGLGDVEVPEAALREVRELASRTRLGRLKLE